MCRVCVSSQADLVDCHWPERGAQMGDPTFAKDIKPLFRVKDRNSMLARFDLWSVDEVRANAPAILGALQAGAMTCGGEWSPPAPKLLGLWIGRGLPAYTVRG